MMIDLDQCIQDHIVHPNHHHHNHHHHNHHHHHHHNSHSIPTNHHHNHNHNNNNNNLAQSIHHNNNRQQNQYQQFSQLHPSPISSSQPPPAALPPSSNIPTIISNNGNDDKTSLLKPVQVVDGFITNKSDCYSSFDHDHQQPKQYDSECLPSDKLKTQLVSKVKRNRNNSKDHHKSNAQLSPSIANNTKVLPQNRQFSNSETDSSVNKNSNNSHKSFSLMKISSKNITMNSTTNSNGNGVSSSNNNNDDGPMMTTADTLRRKKKSHLSRDELARVCQLGEVTFESYNNSSYMIAIRSKGDRKSLIGYRCDWNVCGYMNARVERMFGHIRSQHPEAPTVKKLITTTTNTTGTTMTVTVSTNTNSIQTSTTSSSASSSAASRHRSSSSLSTASSSSSTTSQSSQSPHPALKDIKFHHNNNSNNNSSTTTTPTSTVSSTNCHSPLLNALSNRIKNNNADSRTTINNNNIDPIKSTSSSQSIIQPLLLNQEQNKDVLNNHGYLQQQSSEGLKNEENQLLDLLSDDDGDSGAVDDCDPGIGGAIDDDDKKDVVLIGVIDQQLNDDNSIDTLKNPNATTATTTSGSLIEHQDEHSQQQLQRQISDSIETIELIQQQKQPPTTFPSSLTSVSGNVSDFNTTVDSNINNDQCHPNSAGVDVDSVIDVNVNQVISEPDQSISISNSTNNNEEQESIPLSQDDLDSLFIDTNNVNNTQNDKPIILSVNNNNNNIKENNNNNHQESSLTNDLPIDKEMDINMKINPINKNSLRLTEIDNSDSTNCGDYTEYSHHHHFNGYAFNDNCNDMIVENGKSDTSQPTSNTNDSLSFENETGYDLDAALNDGSNSSNSNGNGYGNVIKKRKTNNSKNYIGKQNLFQEFQNEDVAKIRDTENKYIIALQKDMKIVGYRCDWPECEFLTCRKYVMVNHINGKHTNQRPYSCDMCNFTFVKRYFLKAHMYKVHKRRMSIDKKDDDDISLDNTSSLIKREQTDSYDDFIDNMPTNKKFRSQTTDSQQSMSSYYHHHPQTEKICENEGSTMFINEPNYSQCHTNGNMFHNNGKQQPNIYNTKQYKSYNDYGSNNIKNSLQTMNGSTMSMPYTNNDSVYSSMSGNSNYLSTTKSNSKCFTSHQQSFESTTFDHSSNYSSGDYQNPHSTIANSNVYPPPQSLSAMNTPDLYPNKSSPIKISSMDSSILTPPSSNVNQCRRSAMTNNMMPCSDGLYGSMNSLTNGQNSFADEFLSPPSSISSSGSSGYSSGGYLSTDPMQPVRVTTITNNNTNTNNNNNRTIVNTPNSLATNSSFYLHTPSPSPSSLSHSPASANAAPIFPQSTTNVSDSLNYQGPPVSSLPPTTTKACVANSPIQQYQTNFVNTFNTNHQDYSNHHSNHHPLMDWEVNPKSPNDVYNNYSCSANNTKFNQPSLATQQHQQQESYFSYANTNGYSNEHFSYNTNLNQFGYVSNCAQQSISNHNNDLMYMTNSNNIHNNSNFMSNSNQECWNAGTTSSWS